MPKSRVLLEKEYARYPRKNPSEVDRLKEKENWWGTIVVGGCAHQRKEVSTVLQMWVGPTQNVQIIPGDPLITITLTHRRGGG